MKITFLLSHAPGPRFYKKMKAAKREYEISVVYRNRKSEYFQTVFADSEIEKHEIMNIQDKPWVIPINTGWNFLTKGFAKLRLIQPDVIHCGNLDMLLVACLFKMTYKKDVKIVYEIGDLNSRTFNAPKRLNERMLRRSLMSLERRLCRYVDRIVLSSRYFYDYYYRHFIAEDKILLFPNVPEKETFVDLRKNSNIIPCIGFIGRIRYYEQLRLLLDVVNEINQTNGQQVFRVLIAGVGPQSELLFSEAKEYDFVELYGAYNYDDEIAGLYSRVDLVYSVYDASLPNVQVAIPNRLYEAIVAEKPIIVAKNTKLAEFVERHGVGFAVDSTDGGDLWQLLADIHSETIDLDIVRGRCGLIKDNYYCEVYQERLLDLYATITGLSDQ